MHTIIIIINSTTNKIKHRASLAPKRPCRPHKPHRHHRPQTSQTSDTQASQRPHRDLTDPGLTEASQTSDLTGLRPHRLKPHRLRPHRLRPHRNLQRPH